MVLLDFIIFSPVDEVGLTVIVIIGLWLLDESPSLVAQLTSIQLSLLFWSLTGQAPPLLQPLWSQSFIFRLEALTQLHNLLTKILMGLLMRMLDHIITSRHFTQLYRL